jgi:DNA-binding transcriptional MerR regulator
MLAVSVNLGHRDGMSDDGIDAAELCRQLGIKERTLRSWIHAGVVPRPPYRGTQTRFDAAAVLMAHAVASLRRDRVPLTKIKPWLAKKTPAELREIAGLPPETPPRQLPSDASPPAPVASPPVVNEVVLRGDPLVLPETPLTSHEEVHQGAFAGHEWRRIELLPGLELHVQKDASAFVQGLASAIASGRFAK